MRLLIVLILGCGSLNVVAQELDLTGIEISIDQDYMADFLRKDSINLDRNYVVGLRIGFYGDMANNPNLGLPWIRQKVEKFLLNGLLYNMGFREDGRSHNLVFTINGFSPSHISDEVPYFQEAISQGYNPANDRPFSSFTGFRSTRRLEGSKAIAHSAGRLDLAFNTSFTFGFAGIGLAHGVENLFGSKRPDGNLWSNDDSKPYPTGQISPTLLPMFMYSISVEASVLRPMRQVVVQVRPELNLGYYTNIGIGIDIGKVMNVERLIDNLGYTDTNNPSVLKVGDSDIAFAIAAGGTIKAVLYNAHINALYGASKGDNYFNLSETKKIVMEAYVGFKIQFYKKLELSFSINRRTSEFTDLVNRKPMWGTFGMKYLIASAGEGCYD